MAGSTIPQVLVGVLIVLAAVLVMLYAPKEEDSVVATKDELPVPVTTDAPVTEEEVKKVQVEIETKLGRVRGFEEDIGDGRTIYSFKGIPYAMPPVGELRLKDPVPIEPWSGVKGGETPSGCPQTDMVSLLQGKELTIIGQEDCLYLNVYVPKGPPISPMAVMVFIHGGAYILGNADIFGGTPTFLLKKDVILVSIQYRLGILGFVSTEDSILPGNYGMKDQTQALRWVQDTIGDFGGDPGRVTIFGESAGASSTHLHLFTPYSQGLFQGAILQSGTALAPFAIRDDHKQVAEKIGKQLDCFQEGEIFDSSKLLSCLKTAALEDIVLMTPTLSIWNNMPCITVPRVDGDYIPDHPARLLKDGRYHKVNLMAGIDQNEMGTIASDLVKEDKIKEFIENVDTIAPVLCGIDTEEKSVYMAKKVFYHYIGTTQISEDDILEIEKLISDSIFNILHDEALLFHAQHGMNVYAFEFEHYSPPKLLVNLNMSFEEKWVTHGAEIPYLFTSEFIQRSEDPTNVFLSEIMVELWTQFAITGNPTPDLSLGFKWLSMPRDGYIYLGIKPEASMKNDKRAEQREFWKTLPTKINKILYPELFADDSNTPE